MNTAQLMLLVKEAKKGNRNLEAVINRLFLRGYEDEAEWVWDVVVLKSSN